MDDDFIAVIDDIDFATLAPALALEFLIRLIMLPLTAAGHVSIAP
jgi:hypothetical protein